MESRYISACIRERREPLLTKRADFIKTDKPKKQKQSLTKKDLKYLRNSKERKKWTKNYFDSIRNKLEDCNYYSDC